MRRKRITQRILLIAVTFTLFQPLAPALVTPASADHCAELERRVEALRRDADFLERDLASYERALDSRTERMLEFLDEVRDIQHDLQELPERAREQILEKMGEEFFEAIGTAAGATAALVALALIAPELIPHDIALIVEAAHTAHTSYELYHILHEGEEAISSLNEASALLGEDLQEARRFAQEQGLTELVKLIDTEKALPEMQKRLYDAWQRWLETGFQVELYRGLLEDKRADLQAAADALDACVQEDENQGDGNREGDNHCVDRGPGSWFCP